ncbi:hypothetical protein MKZ38_008449 [Zalerion maritima]|uniref:t-SNARE coiled-coil homology domain-containing protein n=1 Tax=Zalerion maritima TaxID=339359 RepID=A0AAD5RHI5_9PEZI|nr:hypothetical protein MKZ38_008449 [Zalerion maritima]
MSYDQLSSLETGHGGGGGGSGYSDDPQFSRVAQDLENKLFRLASNMSDLRKELSRRDTPRTRERIHNLLEETKGMFQSAGEGLKNLQTWEDVTSTQKYKQQKLSRQLKESLQSFQSLQNQAISRQRSQIAESRAAAVSSPPTSSAGLHLHDDGGHLQLQEQQQLEQQQELSHLAPQDDVDFQDALIREREDEIRAIEQGVGDLNVLFQQVAQIVSEQGEQLNTISDNVEEVHTATEGADFELRQAARYQKNARSKMCCLLIILAVILTIIILAVVLA